MIYHIADQVSWEKAAVSGLYEHPSLIKEGFIHTCHDVQVASVRKRYYAGEKQLILLHIDEAVVSSLIKYELAPSVNEIFPHIYGPLNIDAVIKIEII